MESILLIYTLWAINLALAAACVAVLAVSKVPILEPFLKYGKTLKTENDALLNVYVPKYWFTHFYILHFILSWSNLLLFCSNDECSFNNLGAILLINVFQSSRRLYECIFISESSKTAKIHIFHYLVGIFFYVSINVIPFLKIIIDPSIAFHPVGFMYILIFTLVSWDQHINHKILSNQKKYNLPQIRLFNYVVCPHYFDEIVIYFLCFLFNPSLSYLLIVSWVLINLSISANQSYLFYQSQNQVKSQKRIIPFIY